MAKGAFSDGSAGNSARLEHQKRAQSVQDQRISKFGTKLGKFANFFFAEPKSVGAWKKGALGEVKVGELLDAICQKHNFRVLHDRKVPKSVANLDHIVITDRGIFVIDSKNYRGIVTIKKQGGLFTPVIETLFVGNRKQSRLVDAAKRQVLIVTTALQGREVLIPVFGMLAFYNADWPVLFKPKVIDGILINSKGIENTILNATPIEGIDVQALFVSLQVAFPPR